MRAEQRGENRSEPMLWAAAILAVGGLVASAGAQDTVRLAQGGQPLRAFGQMVKRPEEQDCVH